MADSYIDPKLCTYIPLGKSNSQTKFWFSLILSLATKSAMSPEVMAGSAPNFGHRKCYNSWTNGWIIFLYTFGMGEGATKSTLVEILTIVNDP
jgi:hypothetical protein